MPDLFPADGSPLLPLLLAALLLLVLWLVYRWVRGRGSELDRALNEIAYARIEGLVIPSADEGEIQIDQVLLTTSGLLILEIKEAQGNVFGGDKLQDWTVISAERRYTFPNPQPGLYDRIAAVRQIVRQVPVEGRVLFLGGAEFTKGTPSLVCDLERLVVEFGETDKKAASFKIEAFRPHWELIRRAAGQKT
ncbi:MAG TPA: nuclease-related domain-containing protein [Woeseiaceae bacterium]